MMRWQKIIRVQKGNECSGAVKQEKKDLVKDDDNSSVRNNTAG